MVIVLMGVSGCGKTEIGRRLAGRTGWTFCDADDLHSPENRRKMGCGEALTEADRGPWLQAIARRVQGWLEAGQDAILACSALTRASRRTIGVQRPGVCLVHLSGTFELIGERIRSRRGHFFSADLLRSQFETLEEPERAVVVDVALEPAAIATTILNELGLGGPT